MIGTASQWWAAPFTAMGLRFSLSLIVATVVGTFLHRRKLRYGERLFQSQEILMLLFLGIMLLSTLNGQETFQDKYKISDPPHIKLSKLSVIILIATHTITDRKKLMGLHWVFVIGSLLLGVMAWDLPRRAFIGGRLEGIGGADFSDSNRFGGFMAGMLFLIGAQFLRTGLPGKCLCLAAGAFTANAVILTRSRGALLGVITGMMAALVFTPKRYKPHMTLGLILAGLGIIYVSDPQTFTRFSTTVATEDTRDASAQSRLEIWKGGLRMILDNPFLGVGPGNFTQNIGKYQPLHPDRDAHNTFIRCGAELGIPALLLYCFILLNAFNILRKCISDSSLLHSDAQSEFRWQSFGFMTCLVAIVTYGITGTLIYTEYLWWMLMIPVCIQRSLAIEINTINSQKNNLTISPNNHIIDPTPSSIP